MSTFYHKRASSEKSNSLGLFSLPKKLESVNYPRPMHLKNIHKENEGSFFSAHMIDCRWGFSTPPQNQISKARAS